MRRALRGVEKPIDGLHARRFLHFLPRAAGAGPLQGAYAAKYCGHASPSVRPLRSAQPSQAMLTLMLIVTSSAKARRCTALLTIHGARASKVSQCDAPFRFGLDGLCAAELRGPFRDAAAAGSACQAVGGSLLRLGDQSSPQASGPARHEDLVPSLRLLWASGASRAQASAQPADPQPSQGVLVTREI